MRRDRRALRRTAAVAAAVALAAPADAPAQAVGQTCAVAMTRVDDEDANAVLPDSAARYWIGAYTAAPGTRVRITGRFPHARYMSFNVYDEQGRTVDSLPDEAIQPDPGSVNPFLPGADRTAAERGYTVFIEPRAKPADPAPNTLYAGSNQAGQPHAGGLFVYRVYLPDGGLDDLGGTGLPAASIELLSGGDPALPLDCSGHSRPPSGLGANAFVRALAPPAAVDAVRCPGANPPIWRRNVNAAYSYSDGVLENECTADLHAAAQAAPLGQLGRGGLYGNRDADYLIAPVNRGHGQVLVISGRAPTFPDTRGGATSMPTGAELRYFSFCQYSPFTTRVVDCVADDELPVDVDGDYTLVMSTEAARPADARRECGVGWLAWGPEPEGALLLRNMLPDPGFAFAIQRVATRGAELDALGDYYPRGRYLASAAAFDAERDC